MSSLTEYVKFLRPTLAKLGPTSNLHITIGNESCDLDSMVSALGHAHYLSVKFLPIDPNFTSLPLFHCNRGDLDLRPEAVAVFDQVGVDRDCLLFLDDVNFDLLSSVSHLEITLVDHNTPTGMVARFASKVVGVFDHHEVGPQSVVGRENVQSTVEKVGSCSTLIASKLLRDVDYKVEESLAILLLSAILLDTGNLQAEGRVTDKDRAVAEQLQNLLPKSLDRQAHFDSLVTERFNIAQLTTRQVLQRDFKLVTVCDKYSIGFSSVTALLSDFVKRENFAQDIAEFYCQRELNVLLLLGFFMPATEDVPKQRQIIIYQPHTDQSRLPSHDFAESLASVLEANEVLQCVRVVDDMNAFEGILLDQGNISLSRKQILPIVVQFVNTVEQQHHLTGAAAQHPLEPVITVVSKGEAPVDRIAEYSALEETKESRTHRFVNVMGDEHVIDMAIVQPYRQIIQHAGYIGEDRTAVVVISASYLPSRSLHNYKTVANETFYYVLSVLDKLIVDKYMIVFLNSGAPRHSRPSFNLLHKFYQLVDHRFRKQLMQVYIVHPTFLVKTVFTLARPFISTKFWRKVKYIRTLDELSTYVTIDKDLIPTPVSEADQTIMAHLPSHERYQSRPSEGGSTSPDRETGQ